MSATLTDGKVRAARLRETVANAADVLKREKGVEPGLAVVLVGEDSASQVYVASKVRLTKECGMRSIEHILPAETSQADLLALVQKLNADESVDGILVQMPLSDHIDSDAIVLAIDPAKDVDGLHPVNAGRIVLGKPGLVPCTPQGCVILVKEVMAEKTGGDLSGLDALVLGRSILVGKPMALLLQNENCTVTMAHSCTRNLEEACRRADIVVAAVGRPRMVKGDWLKPGACVIDVGINRIPAPEKGEGKTRLVGDVDFDSAVDVADSITPVPGGVGPMTIACLLANTIRAACKRRGFAVPDLG
ncbi:bifunctional methylenetetrahydrofolate dehydrogenase/methenyltetrahydrofolate cyclohydrolase FolD [Breoghania sp.]|uniref:bifunctional methylenetetrahydrofolate dehydrogenase/methenyltetrahydrofolate cyclohydrolase FolD n=1 Tax=Breoghania sp. TaxID=2065378 RepID=UPI002615D5F6|nr:bifunctional methylenetetrahydrofolate dehydrogenase/methenyltetrahydrofolate cyclohydrolase FolD [Breoghania sp.]MDJ0930617.1 bifunctional methylenetetrahydrofolate dehydrogenase/methenyltetrahydrofolate cyclohydrolase FolD [Breoghania sp.]